MTRAAQAVKPHASCRATHVSPETAAVILAADRVADLPDRDWMGALYPALVALRESVYALRQKREKDLGE